jgi:hypothetical protein
MVHHTLEQRVFLYDAYVKYISAVKCQQKFQCKFCDEKVHSRQIIRNLEDKLRTTGLLIHKKKHMHQALTEVRLDGIGDRFEHTPENH